MDQNVAYGVTFSQFDGTTITRTLYREDPAACVSSRQLAGFLTHSLFSDVERQQGNFFTIATRYRDNDLQPLVLIDVFTVQRVGIHYQISQGIH